MKEKKCLAYLSLLEHKPIISYFTFFEKKSIQCFKHPISNSNNTHSTCITKPAYIFISDVKLSMVLLLKTVRVTRYSYSYSSFASSGIWRLEPSVLTLKSISSRLASPKIHLLISYLFEGSVFFFSCFGNQHHQFIFIWTSESIPSLAVAVTW